MAGKCGSCTPARLHELLEYDPLTGLFRWRNPTSRQAVGWFRGNKSVRNYRRLFVDGKHVMAHQAAVAMMTGEWHAEIDHRDRDHGNNAWGNLRSCTHAENGRNRSVGKNSSTGVVGVSRFGERFRASVSVSGKRISLGIYDTLEAAAKARRGGEIRHHGEFRGGK